VLSTLLLFSFAAVTINASTLIIGSNNDLTRYPFGKDPGNASAAFPDFAAGGTYQQVYASNAFSGPVTITQIAFASKSQLTSGAGTATYNFNISLGTTQAAPGGLSTNLAANRGADLTGVFAGAKTATITAGNQFDLVIDITPFTYNPANGNLLMEVNFNAPTQFTGGAILYFNAGFNASASRAANPSGAAGGAFTDGFSIQTRFTTKSIAQVALGNQLQTFDGSPKSVTVTTDPAGLNVIVTYDGSTTPPTDAGVYAVTATINEPDFIGEASGNLLISKASQQIAFDPLPNRTLTDADFGINAAASSNLPVSFAASGPCTLNGNLVHLTGVGACTITASQDGNANINAAAPVARTFSISKAEQQITFDALTDKKFGDADFDVSATASSNLPVTFSASGNCTISGAQVHITGAGSCTIEATQAGDANNNAAAPVSRSFAISKATAVITLGDLAQSFDGTAKSATATTNPAGLNVTLAYSQSNVPVASPINAGSYDVTASIDDANHEGSASGTLVISKATPVITWQNPQDITYGTALSLTQLNATANVAGTLDYTPAAGTVLHTGAGQPLQVSFTPEDANNFEAVSKNVTINVLRAELVVRADDKTRPFGSSNPPLTFAITGFVNNNTQAGATAGQPSLTTAAQPNSDAGVYPITAALGTLTSNDYSLSFVDGALTVTKAEQVITFGALPNKRFGDAPFTVSATGEASNNAINFSSQTPAVCSVAGNTVTLLGAGICTIRASQSGSNNHNAATDVDQSFEVAKALTTVTLASSANPSALGQAVTFTATVASGAGVPSGKVQFIIDGVNQGNPRTLNSLGVASGSTDILTAGNHKVTAEYLGDANFASSSGALAEEQTVNVAVGISINDASLAEGDAGTKSFDFTVTLSTPGNVAVTVDFATTDGTGRAGTDYQSTTGTLSFAAGETSKTITVPVNGNTTSEPNKTFFVNLTNAQNATLIDAQGVGTILNDDAPGVQFSQNSDSFSEGAGHGNIIVTRTGDISEPMTVDYQTLDQSALVPCQTNNTGFASDRCDYETAAGTLQFAAGEAQKVIPLVLVNDAYVEPAEQLSIRLINPTGGSLGIVDTANVTITDDDTQLATQNPIDETDFFIRQLYIDFLGREPDADGFQFWKARMTGNCPAGQTCDRVDTALRFFDSDEFRERGYFVYLFYHASLGRRPTYSEWILDVSKLNGFKTVAEQEAAKEAFINEFMSRQEFMTFYNGAQTGQAFVDALVRQSGVAPASRQALIDNYQPTDRAKTLRAFLETPEVQAAFVDRAFVTMLYFGFLRRDAEAGGFNFWMQKLNETNHDTRFLFGGFLQSDEYHFRFALLPLAQ
jgi:hypothetical protein